MLLKRKLKVELGFMDIYLQETIYSNAIKLSIAEEFVLDSHHWHGF